MEYYYKNYYFEIKNREQSTLSIVQTILLLIYPFIVVVDFISFFCHLEFIGNIYCLPTLTQGGNTNTQTNQQVNQQGSSTTGN